MTRGMLILKQETKILREIEQWKKFLHRQKDSVRKKISELKRQLKRREL